MAEWDDIHYICLTADRLVLTHPPHMLTALCCELTGYIEVEEKQSLKLMLLHVYALMDNDQHHVSQLANSLCGGSGLRFGYNKMSEDVL